MSRPAHVRATSCAERPSRRRSALQAVLLLAVLLLSGVLASGAASAHAQLRSVDPPDGAVVELAPAAVTLKFNEPVGLAAGGLRVIDATGTPIDQGEEVVTGPVVSQALAPLPDGWYVVTWGIISEDGHIVRASSVFGVGDADAAARPDAAADGGSALLGLARAVGDLGILVAGGAWAAWWLLGARMLRVRRLALVATLVALAGSVAWGLLESQDGGSAWMATSAATLTILRVVLLAIALVPAGLSSFVPAGAVGLSLLTLAGGGHAAGDPLPMVALSAHLLAGVVWLGAAPAMVLVLRDPGIADGDAAAIARRFSRSAGFALVAVGVAGTLLALNLTDRFAGGLTTPWVLVLLGKVALVGIAALLGAWGRRHLAAAADRGRLGRLFLLDAALLVGVATLSAGLTLSSPHAGHAGHGGHGSDGSSRCAAIVGAGSVSVIAAPGRVGSNEVSVGGIPADVRSVTLSWRHKLTEGGALTMEAAPGETAWEAAGALPFAGSWEVTVDVRVDTFTQQSGACRLRIEP